MKPYLQKLTETVRAQWDQPALSDYRGATFCYRDVAMWVESLHLICRASGIGKGDRIVLCGRNSASWAVAYLATITSGSVAVPILPNFTPEGIQTLVNHSESVLLLVDEEIANTLSFDAMPNLKAMVSVEGLRVLQSRDEVTTQSFEAREALFSKAHPEGLKPEEVSYGAEEDETLAVINYTSGTTSAPKGVMFCHRNFTATIGFAQNKIKIGLGDHIVSMLPMAHMYGLVFEFLYPVISGVTVHYLGKAPSPSKLMAAMKEIRPCMVITVPLVMEKIFRSSIRPALSSSKVKTLLRLPFVKSLLYRKAGQKLLDSFGGNVKHIVLGGAPLDFETETCFHKMKLPITIGYGMTEACPLLCYEDWWKFEPGSCGKPIDTCTVRVDSPDPLHEVGEIQAKGSNICLGYYKNPEATAGAFTEDGYLKTGDLGKFDRKGNLFICGRSKNLILSATGQNIYPEEIESIVNRQDFVAESVVVGRDMRVVARVYLDPDAIRKAGLSEVEVAALPEQIRKAVNALLPNYSQLAKVEVDAEPYEKTPKMSIKRFLYK